MNDWLLDDLVRFYQHYEPWHPPTKDESLIRNIYKYLLEHDRIVSVHDNHNLLGYIESYRIGYDTLGEIICHRDIDPREHNVTDGNICYLSSCTVHPKFRGTDVMKALKLKFFEQNFMCEFFIGESRTKKHQPLKVFTRQEFYDKYAKDFAFTGEVVENGKG